MGKPWSNHAQLMVKAWSYFVCNAWSDYVQWVHHKGKPCGMQQRSSAMVPGNRHQFHKTTEVRGQECSLATCMQLDHALSLHLCADNAPSAEHARSAGHALHTPLVTSPPSAASAASLYATASPVTWALTCTTATSRSSSASLLALWAAACRGRPMGAKGWRGATRDEGQIMKGQATSRVPHTCSLPHAPQTLRNQPSLPYLQPPLLALPCIVRPAPSALTFHLWG